MITFLSISCISNDLGFTQLTINQLKKQKQIKQNLIVIMVMAIRIGISVNGCGGVNICIFVA